LKKKGGNSMNGWVGVDLDGTIAKYDGWHGPEHIGEPIPLMVDRVKSWIAEGLEIKIFTARVCSGNSAKEESLKAIEIWCLKHLGKILPVTAEKDYEMLALWDDRAVQVIENTGVAVQDLIEDVMRTIKQINGDVNS
jgi:hypothetical protein